MMSSSDFHLGNLSLRAATEQDHPFLLELFASTREEELAIFGADENQKRAFVTMQYNAMTRCYPKAESTIILAGDVRIGRMIVDRKTDELRLVDISLLPEFRKRGIGAILVRQLLHDARVSQLPVRLHVFKYGDAVRFYERLGFELIEDDGTYLKMEWQPKQNNT